MRSAPYTGTLRQADDDQGLEVLLFPYRSSLLSPFSLRARALLIYYPLSMGRNSAEILRAIDAAQAADQHGIATPVNWRPGDEVIVCHRQPTRRRCGSAGPWTGGARSRRPTGTPPKRKSKTVKH